MDDRLTFLTPLAWAITPAFFWAGLVAVAIPILIHLLNRRRFKVVRWAAMEYLLQAMRKNRRRIQFEQLALLAVRCTLLALLGLALARPLGCADSPIAAFAGQKSGLHVFVIDNSYSMAYEADRPEARTHLDQARLLARQQIDRLAPGNEAVAIVSAARLARGRSGDKAASDDLILLRPTYDLEAARTAIDRIPQSFGSTDLPGALQAAAQLAREQGKQPNRLLYVLTDFTRSAWEGRAEILRQTGQDLVAVFGRHIRISNLGREGQWNYAVLDVRPDSGLVTPQFNPSFLADVKGYGSGPETIVQWQWNDTLLPDTARIKPDATTDLQRQTKAQVRSGGAHVLSVSLVGGEKLKLDNVRHRVIEVASELKVLIVEGERGTGMLSGSGAFLDLALAPRKEAGPGGAVRSDSYVAPELVSDLELSNKVLTDYRAIIFSNVGSITAQQADQLQRFVRQGGTFLCFMGEQVNPDVYNSILLPRKLLPGKLVVRKSVSADAKGFTLDFKPNGDLHPLLGVFRGEERSGLDTAQIYTYYQVELERQLRPEIVLRYLAGEQQTNDPAITVHGLDKGRVVLVTTTANPDWSGLPPKPAYPALIHELLAGNVDIGDRWMNLTVGQPVVVPPTLKLSSAPTLADPSRKPVPIDAVTEADQTFYRSKPLDKPGLYQLNIGSKVLPIAVNVPSDEADIRLIPPDAVRKALGEIDMEILGDTLPEAALARQDNTDFGWTLMLFVLVLVGLESFLAMRFGHYRRKP